MPRCFSSWASTTRRCVVGVGGSAGRLPAALAASLCASCHAPFPSSQNELGIMEFIHCIVETMDRYFSNVCELDIMYSLETVRESGGPGGKGVGCARAAVDLRR